MRPMTPTCPRPLASMPRASPTGERLSVWMGVGVGADGVQSMCVVVMYCVYRSFGKCGMAPPSAVSNSSNMW